MLKIHLTGIILLFTLTACFHSSDPDSAASNTAPVANAGDNQTVVTLSTVSLSASGSTDADGDALTYAWSLTTIPSGSSASLSTTDTVQTSFVADVDGTYVVSLVANDGLLSSNQDTVSIVSQDASASSSADFYTPTPIINALQLTRSISWAELSDTPTNLTRFSMGETASNNIFVLTDLNESVAASLSIVSELALQTSASDDELLRTMFKFIENADGSLRITASKHSNYALDVNNPGVNDNLILRDTRSGSKDDSSAAYLGFTVTGTSPMILTATSRFVFNSTSDEYEASIWSSQQVLLSSNTLTLTTGTGSQLTLYTPPIDLAIPFDFNPDETTRVDNAEVTPQVKGSDPLATTPTDVVSKYRDQVTVAGSNDATNTAAQVMITAIEASLSDEGAQLRYPAEFYLAFRAGLFSRILQSSDSTDGVLGELTVPYVFFTNEADNDGVHHPFMVIASYGLPDSLSLLWDVAKPPGDGLVQEYNNQSVTRSHHREAFLMKIPLRDYGEVSSLTENTMVNDLASDVNESALTHHNYASVSATGVAIDGVVIYPSYNNALHVAQSAAELSAHGMHSGRGLGVHYHADAHSATGEGLNLYNSHDYTGHSHPPIVSMGFDGVAGYGVYQSGDSSSDGVDIALDDFGGHEHGDYGYHYHSFTKDEVTASGAGPNDPVGGVSYTSHNLPPLGAWAGRINDIPEFWDGTSPNYVGGASVYLGTQ